MNDNKWAVFHINIVGVEDRNCGGGTQDPLCHLFTKRTINIC